MEPTSFDESNHVLGPPKGISEQQCSSLSVFMGTAGDTPVVVSCWKVTKEELKELNRTGRIWLMIHGHNMPPVSLNIKSPFSRQ